MVEVIRVGDIEVYSIKDHKIEGKGWTYEGELSIIIIPTEGGNYAYVDLTAAYDVTFAQRKYQYVSRNDLRGPYIKSVNSKITLAENQKRRFYINPELVRSTPRPNVLVDYRFIKTTIIQLSPRGRKRPQIAPPTVAGIGRRFY